MNNPQKKEDLTITNGRRNIPQLNYSELLELIAYHLHKSEVSQFEMSYPIVNICILILKFDHNTARKRVAQQFLVYAFRFFIRKWVMRNYNRIRKYFNTSINGKHQDMSDVYQELYIYFFDLVYQFNIQGDVYFVVFLNRYLFYWMNNRFKPNKKEKINQVSLESIIADTGDDSAPVKFEDALQAINASPLATGASEEEELEERMMDKMIMEDFEYTIINNSDYFKTHESQKIYKKVYTYFFIDGQTNKSDLARQMDISQQKVRYYLDKLHRMFNSYMRNT